MRWGFPNGCPRCRGPTVCPKRCARRPRRNRTRWSISRAASIRRWVSPATPSRGTAGRKDGRAAPQGGLRGCLSREHGTSLLRHNLGKQGHGRHRRPQDRRAGRGALARQRGGTLAGAVRPEPLPAPHAREDRPHETLRTGGIHLDLPARPAGVPALSPCMSPARCAAWGCPG